VFLNKKNLQKGVKMRKSEEKREKRNVKKASTAVILVQFETK